MKKRPHLQQIRLKILGKDTLFGHPRNIACSFLCKEDVLEIVERVPNELHRGIRISPYFLGWHDR